MGKRVLVIGDIIADVYRDLREFKRCPDAPDVPVVREVSCVVKPGGAANVALNVKALSPETDVDLIGIIGGGELGIRGVHTGFCVEDRNVETVFRKERVRVNQNFLYRNDSLEFHADLTRRLLGELEDYLDFCTPDLIVFSDYGLGTVDELALDLLLQHRDRLLVDSKRRTFAEFGVGGQTLLLKLNALECNAAKLLDPCFGRNFVNTIVTNGREGATLHIVKPLSDEQVRRHPYVQESFVEHKFHVSAKNVETVDPCGCGDTFIAGVAASLLENEDVFTAVQFGNAAAATVVVKPGTAVASLMHTLMLLGREFVA